MAGPRAEPVLIASFTEDQIDRKEGRLSSASEYRVEVSQQIAHSVHNLNRVGISTLL